MKLGKMSIGSMNLEELLKGVWMPETSQSTRMEGSNGSSATLLQCQNSLGLSGTLSEKIVDEKMKSSEGVKREPTTCEMTLEDFLTKEDAMDESCLSPVLPMDIPGTPKCFSQDIADTPVSLRRRNTSDIPDRSFEKRLKRKIKNRESAARSRARKQAYRNELVGKVSHLEEQNMRLKREKELENHLCFELSDEPRYQLRRTSSAIF